MSYTPEQLRDWAERMEKRLDPTSDPDQLRAHADALEEIERVRRENDTLRGLLGNSAKPCPYCGLAAEDQAKCASGFPGCARADDQMLSKHFADAYRAERAEAALAEAERKIERLKFHAEAMAHYTDCYASKWPDSGANYTLEAYRAEFKEE